MRAGAQRLADLAGLARARGSAAFAHALAAGGQAQWQRVLNTEWGGMNEVLFNLYALTKDDDHLTTGRYFNHWSWSAPLAAGV